MRSPQMWHVVWLHGAMEWKETSLAQMKQISWSSSSSSSPRSPAPSGAGRGLAAAATAAAAGLTGTGLAASRLRSALELALERLALRRWPPALERFPLPRPPPRPDLAEEEAPPLELPPRGPDEDAGGAGPFSPEDASIGGGKCADVSIRNTKGSVVVRAGGRGRICIWSKRWGLRKNASGLYVLIPSQAHGLSNGGVPVSSGRKKETGVFVSFDGGGCSYGFRLFVVGGRKKKSAIPHRQRAVRELRQERPNAIGPHYPLLNPGCSPGEVTQATQPQYTPTYPVPLSIQVHRLLVVPR